MLSAGCSAERTQICCPRNSGIPSSIAKTARDLTAYEARIQEKMASGCWEPHVYHFNDYVRSGRRNGLYYRRCEETEKTIGRTEFDVRGNPQPVDYQLLKLVGEGGYGRVYSARCRATGKEVALKQDIAGGHTWADRVRREIRVLAKMNFYLIAKLYEVFYDDMPRSQHSLVYVMEMVPGQNLFDHQRSQVGRRFFSFSKAREFFTQMLTAVKYVHDQGCAGCRRPPGRCSNDTGAP